MEFTHHLFFCSIHDEGFSVLPPAKKQRKGMVCFSFCLHRICFTPCVPVRINFNTRVAQCDLILTNIVSMKMSVESLLYLNIQSFVLYLWDKSGLGIVRKPLCIVCNQVHFAVSSPIPIFWPSHKARHLVFLSRLR